jgi:hypothetical protein
VPGKKRASREPDVPLYFGLTPNQVVAYNLAQARLLRNWTQEEAAEALEPYLGRRWSKASFSAAERSVDGDRIRQFEADEIVAFARAFHLPVSWFFLPPPPWAAPGIPARLKSPGAERFGEPLALLADLVFGDDEQRAVLELRLQAFLQELGPNPLSDAQARITQLVDAKKDQLVRHAVSDLGRWQTQLRALANHLEDLERRAEASARRELDSEQDSSR